MKKLKENKMRLKRRQTKMDIRINTMG